MHHFNVRVYYEDVDIGGVVYHANYVKYFERARTQHLSDLGLELITLWEEHKIHFLVKNLDVEFKQSAKLNDKLTVSSEILHAKGAKLIYKQAIHQATDNLGQAFPLVEALITLGCVGVDNKPNRLPKKVIELLAPLQ